MKLEDQVCSLELSKRLQDLGVNQDSYFWWCDDGYKFEVEFMESDVVNKKMCIAAFTVAELGEMLFPFNIVTYKYKKGKNFIYEVMIQDMEMRISKKYEPSHKADSEVNARAKMLIYLIENKLISL